MDIGLNIFKGVTRNFYSSNGDKINNLWRCEQQVRNKCIYIYITNKSESSPQSSHGNMATEVMQISICGSMSPQE